MYSGSKKKMNRSYLFQYKLSYRNETGANNHGLLFTSISCFNIFLSGASTCGGGESLPNFIFFNINPQIFQRNRKVYLSKCLETNFHNISNVSLRVIGGSELWIMQCLKKKVFSPKY